MAWHGEALVGLAAAAGLHQNYFLEIYQIKASIKSVGRRETSSNLL